MKLFFRYTFFICSLAIMGIIFYFSSQKAAQSSESSWRISQFLAGILYNGFDNLSVESKELILKGISGAIRIAAHFCEYAALSFFVASALFTFNIKRCKALVFCLLFILFYAVTDEIHQYFVPGRAFQFLDIAVDFCGGVLGALICAAAVKIFVKTKAK